jgi:hypothetical protein
MCKKILFLSFLPVILCGAVLAQTSSFVYQGKLQDSGLAANGTYQFQFKLYDAETGGNQISQSIADVTATTTNGIFAVNLNFGAGAFNSQNFRFLEIGVRPNGSQAAYTILNPRQQVTSTPYAIRALTSQEADHATEADNSANLGGVPAAQYVITTDPRMSDDRDPLPGSASYIQNGTNQQSASNFNISGEGKANKMTGVFVNATSEFQQGGTRVMQFNVQKSGVVGLFAGPNSTGSDNMFVGYQAGNANTTGNINTIVGSQSGKSNTTGFNNAFFGAYSGFSNTTGTNNAFFGANTGLTSIGSFNSFFGSNAGFNNFSGTDNSFFGNGSGINNSTGSGNSFFGRGAGESVTIAGNNSFFGTYAGENTTTGGNAYFGAFAGQKNNVGFGNVFVGFSAGKENVGGSSNTFVGVNSGQNAGAVGNNNTALGANAKVGLNVNNATAIGANVFATQSNSVYLGTASAKVYIDGNLQVAKNATFDDLSALSVKTEHLDVGNGLFVVDESEHSVAFDTGIDVSGNVSAEGGDFSGGISAHFVSFKLLAGGGSFELCYNANGPDPLASKSLASCSSSRRYKDNIEDFKSGLSLVERLRPVTFDWKSNKQHDVGFVAEEVAEVEPLLATYNETGQIEGVKYAQITTVLVNAVKEQQAQIEALKAVICSAGLDSSMCVKTQFDKKP